MALFNNPLKTFINDFRNGEWASEALRKDAVAAIKASGKIPFRNMIQIIQSLHPTESSRERVRSRMACLEELLDGVKNPSLTSSLLDILGVVDSNSRESLIRILIQMYQKEQSAFYIDYLKSEDINVRRGISEILTAVGGKTVFELLKEKITTNSLPSLIEVSDILCAIAGHHAIDILKSIAGIGKREDRLHALELLANPDYMKLRKRKALDAAYGFLRDSDSAIRMKVVEIISRYGSKEDVPVLLEMLNKEEKRNLQAVIEAIGKIGDADCIPTLLPYMESSYTGIKVTVINAIGNFGDDRCIEPLIEALRDKNLLIRQRTIEVLGEIGKRTTIGLGRLLVSMMRDRDVNVRRSVVEVIRLISDQQEDLWWKLIRYLRDEDWWVRERITEILAEIGGEKIVDPIISLLEDSSELVRRYAIEVLMRLGSIKAVEPLIKCLKDQDWWVQERAVEALAELGDRRAVPYLNGMLIDAGDLIWTIVNALKKFAHKSSFLPLLQLIDHPSPEIRMEIIEALDAIGDERFKSTLAALINDEDRRVRDLATALLPKYQMTARSIRRKTYESITIGLLDEMLLDVKARGGEDLFIIAGNRPMMKVRGDVEMLDDHVFSADETQQLLFNILTPMQQEQFDQINEIDMSYSIKDELSRFRVNMYLCRTGVSAVFRVINREILNIELLGLPKPVYDFTQLRQGLVLVTGPTGSGKSTTLAAMIDYMNRTRQDHIITIEDPIEYVHENKQCVINQREMGAHTSSFTNALRSALREDPDIILVGEMRDLETISIAITAAETGHLVLGTLHTVSAAKTVDRIIDVFPGRQQAQVRAMLSESLRGVISQQLMKRRDTDGRILALEVMICNDAIAHLIRKEKIFQIPSIITTSYEAGMTLMDNELMRLVKEGLIYPEDAYIKSINKKEFEHFLIRDGNNPM